MAFLERVLALWLPVINLLSFLLMGCDKRFARAGRRRIPERRLWLCAALGGGLGGCAGMLVFRHKTRHRAFQLGMPALLIVQLALLLFFFSR